MIKTRILRIWKDINKRDNILPCFLSPLPDKGDCPAVEYQGEYLETYDIATGVRIGLIYDRVKNCVAVFRQECFRDIKTPRITDIMMGLRTDSDDVTTIHKSWSCDTEPETTCYCDDFKERAPTEAEMKEIQMLRQGLPTETEITKPQSQNIFQKTGEHWEIRFKGSRQVSIHHRKGFEYILELLAHPNQFYTPTELIDGVKKKKTITPFDAGLHVGAKTRQEIIDKKGMTKTLSHLNELRAELKKPDISPAERKETENEIEAIEKELSSTTFQGKAKTFKTQADADARKSTKAIKEAEEAIRKHLPELAKYFHIKINKGKNLYYSGEIKFKM